MTKLGYFPAGNKPPVSLEFTRDGKYIVFTNVNSVYFGDLHDMKSERVLNESNGGLQTNCSSLLTADNCIATAG